MGQMVHQERKDNPLAQLGHTVVVVGLAPHCIVSSQTTKTFCALRYTAVVHAGEGGDNAKGAQYPTPSALERRH